jgi:2-methylcitrate dehydratase PrpD
MSAPQLVVKRSLLDLTEIWPYKSCVGDEGMEMAEKPTVARTLAGWAQDLAPNADDLALARRSLMDTVAVTLAARDHPIRRIVADLPAGARWATLGHVLDFDDLHLESTTHISAVIVPTVLATGGDDRAYLAGAGVMARLGMALGWRHYSSGWHATCTAGAPAAAVAAGVTLGLDAEGMATAMALAVPAAGGVQAAFGTHAKSLQVGFAVEAGIRAARLAHAGASANARQVDEWLSLLGGDPSAVDVRGPAVPGGLAIKLFPCCYAMQRPIAALREVADRLPADPGDIVRIRVSTPESSVQPLIHDRPSTGLEGKFSLPYAVATAVLDSYPGFAAFSDTAVARAQARRLMSAVEITRIPGGTGLLDGEVAIEVETAGTSAVRSRLGHPRGCPRRPPTDDDLQDKLAACGADVPALLSGMSWPGAGELMRTTFPHPREATK